VISCPTGRPLDLLVPFNVQAGNMLVAYVNNLTQEVYGQVVDTEFRRWMQFSALRSHILVPWDLGLRMPMGIRAGCSGHVAATRRFLELRYSLIRTSIRNSRRAHDDGEPLCALPTLSIRRKRAAYEFRHQYLLWQICW